MLHARSVSNASVRSVRICAPCVSILVNSGVCFKSKYSIYERQDYFGIYNAEKYTIRYTIQFLCNNWLFVAISIVSLATADL